jgi:putative ABC transport system ATP-binding protein
MMNSGQRGNDAPAAALQARGLTKIVQDATGSLTILDDINLDIAGGETVAIIGASGSGKSTLLGLLAGLDVPTRGEVRLFGAELFAADEDGRARLRAEKIGFVFQSFQLLPHLSALENVLLPMELSGRTPDGIDAPRAAREMLARVGLGGRLSHYPKTLSGGEQQRVALARAVVLRPPLLLADEPTGSLDARTGEAVIELMFELNRERGSTLVLVTHDSQIAARCGRRIEIQAGRIVAG